MSLASLPSPVCSPSSSTWHWAPDSSYLAICFGDAWVPGAANPCGAGIMFVNTSTNLVLSMPSQAALLRQGSAPRVCGWSPTSRHLLVRHSQGEDTCFLMYPPTFHGSGKKPKGFAAPCSDDGYEALAGENCFAPDGLTIALTAAAGRQTIWMWQVDRRWQTKHWQGKDVCRPGGDCLAWSPCSQRLLVLGGACMLLVSREAQLLARLSGSGDQYTRGGVGVGGIAVFYQRLAQAATCYAEVSLFDHALYFTRSLRPVRGVFWAEHGCQVAISADGAHLLAVSCRVSVTAGLPATTESHMLLVFCLAECALLQRHALPFAPYSVRWMSDSQAAVMDAVGEKCMMISFT